MTKQRPGWRPFMLREHREAHGLTIEAAWDKLRQVADHAELRIAEDFEAIYGHEIGAVYPGPHYRRAYCLMYHASEPNLGFRLALPGERCAEAAAVPVPKPSTSPTVTEEAVHAISGGLDEVTDHTQTQDGTLGEVLKNRVVSAWSGRALTDGIHQAVLVLVGGYAGSGKTEFARFLGDVSGWAFLDKDSLTRRLVEKLLISLGGDQHDRHTDLYLNEVRPLEYECLMDTAYDNIDCGISTILAAPFIAEMNNQAWMSRLANRCRAKGVEVAAVWIRCDIDSMREYIEFRGYPRDTWKLEHWDEYASGLNTETSPPGAHLTIDNRMGTAISIVDQVRDALRRILG